MRGQYREKIFQRYQSVDSRSRQGKVLVADEPGCLDFRQTGKGWILADVKLRSAHFGNQVLAHVDGGHGAVGAQRRRWNTTDQHHPGASSCVFCQRTTYGKAVEVALAEANRFLFQVGADQGNLLGVAVVRRLIVFLRSTPCHFCPP